MKGCDPTLLKCLNLNAFFASSNVLQKTFFSKNFLLTFYKHVRQMML